MKVIVEQGDLLDALMALIKDEDTDSAAEILRKLVKESEPVGVATPHPAPPNTAPLNGQAPRLQAPTQTTEPSPSSKRLDELRDLHGPVFRVIPKSPVEIGQKLKNADGTSVEMIEADDLPQEDGNVKEGAWFAKRCE